MTKTLLKKIFSFFFKDHQGRWTTYLGGKIIEVESDKCTVLDEIEAELKEEMGDIYEQFLAGL